jgi:MoxR-like ATPase
MDYLKQYDASRAPKVREGPTPKGDLRDGSVYVYEDEIELAVNVALATGRPLLVAGPPGSGKSSLAPNVARTAGWRFEQQVISSATEARDLMWTFDAVGRLRDAQAAEEGRELRDYVKPEVLWRAFDPVSAQTRGQRTSDDAVRAVVLLDEIDKADPDVPNNLLVPLGSWEFDVSELDVKVAAGVPPLVILTTNDERELSKPFVRRCVVLTLERPDQERLERIAAPLEFRRRIQSQIVELEDRRGPGTARVERECPFCAEPILTRARVCKHCGRDVEPA